QMSIQSSNEYVGRMLGCCVEVNDLADCVNAGVGSPAGVGMRSFTGERRNGGFQSLLNGSKPRLCLAAEEVGVIVAHGQLNVAHRTAQDSSFHPSTSGPPPTNGPKITRNVCFSRGFRPSPPIPFGWRRGCGVQKCFILLLFWPSANY